MTDFEIALKSAAEKAVLKIISEGSWIAPDYANRFKIPASMLEDIEELADKIINRMAEEISTDVKQILSVKERKNDD